MCCKKGGKRNCSGHQWVSIVGLSLSFFELILASVYNFHMLGFGLSIIGILTSGLYLHFAIKDQRVADSATNQINAASDDADEAANPLAAG